VQGCRVNARGFDDGPFLRGARGSVLLVGAVCAGTRLDGISGAVMWVALGCSADGAHPS
jgi:hypothetical protein